MTNETIFHQVGSVLVTNTRFVANRKTFAIQKIASVTGTETPARYANSIAGIFMGVAFSWIGFMIPGYTLIISGVGLLILILSIFQLRKQKRFYSIVLGIGSAEIIAYRSTNREHVEKIMQSLNQAIVYRG